MRALRLHSLVSRPSIYESNSRSIIHTLRLFSSTPIRNDLTPFTRRLFKLPSAPFPPSQHHDNLAQFLAYASRTSLPESSTVYVGTHYEYTVLQSLRRYALALHRIGGRDDAGIDLAGTWHLPAHEGHALRVLVQCKALKTKLGPNLVRELEGALRQAPVGWRTGQTVGVLVSPREATKGVRDALARSSFPLFWMMVERDGSLRQALWNAKAEQLGLGSLGVETRYGSAESTSDSELRKEVVLTWDGCDIPDMDTVELGLARSQEQWASSWVEDPGAVDKNVLLDTIETIFPDGAPEPESDGTVAEMHRVKVRKALQGV